MYYRTVWICFLLILCILVNINECKRKKGKGKGKPSKGKDQWLDKVTPKTPAALHESCTKNKCNSGDLGCHCDLACHLFGDCCLDMPNPKPEIDPQFNVKVKDAMECSTKNDFPLAEELFVVKRCPNDYNGAFIKSKCESVESTDSFLRWPVSSSKTGVTYRNYYCSICWNEINSIEYWKLDVDCNEYYEKTGHSDELEKINASAKYDKIVKIMNHCKREYKPPNKDIKPISDKARNCTLGHVQECEEDNDNATLCKNEPTRIVRSNTTIYKNVYCALCQGEKFKDLSCLVAPPTFAKMPPGDMSLLFDMSMKSSELRGNLGSLASGESCTHGEYFDFVHQRCRPVDCGSGFLFESGICRISSANVNDSCVKLTYYKNEYQRNPNGTVYLESLKLSFNVDEYTVGESDSIQVCVDETAYGVNRSNGSLILNQFLTNNSRYKIPEVDGVLMIISVTGETISVISLFILVVIYLLFPKLRNVPGKCVISLSIALILGHSLHLLSPAAMGIYTLCYILGVATHASFLSVFFWMNTLAFDFVQTFRATTVGCQDEAKSRKRFRNFSFYSWLSPVAIVSLSIGLDMFADQTKPYNPAYAQPMCWLNNSLALGALFVLPVGIIITANMIMYGMTVYSIYKTSKEAEFARKGTKINLILYMKLSVLLGGTWIFAFIWSLSRSVVLKYIFVILSCLQGFFIFLVFVCRKKVFSMCKGARDNSSNRDSRNITMTQSRSTTPLRNMKITKAATTSTDI